MAWIRIDDQLWTHPKITGARFAEPESLTLWLLALSYSAHYLTDGQVDQAFVRSIVPQARKRERIVAALVDSGLWEKNGTGWVIHDYLEYNRSRDEVLERRGRDRRRASRPERRADP